MPRYFLLLSVLLWITRALLGQDSPFATAPAVSDLLKNAEKAYYSGEFEAAIEAYQAALRQDAKLGEAYAGLTRVYLKQHKIGSALETAHHGVEQALDSRHVHTALGEVYFRQAKMQEAEREFLSAINTPPPDARACLGLSRLYAAYSLHARARRMLNRAHELDPNDPEISRRWILTQKRSDQIRWLEEHLGGPTNDDSRERRGAQEWLAFLQARQQQPHSSCRLATKLAATETTILRLGDPFHFHGYGLDVKVNGHSTHLELDTGASGLLITKALANKAGITPLSNIHMSGVGDQGDAAAFLGYADSIKIGQLEFQNCLVTVSDKHMDLAVDGLIGANVFGQYLVTIDFPYMKLKLEELPQPPGQTQQAIGLSTEEEGEEESDGKGEHGVEQTEAVKTQADSGPQDAYVAPEMQAYTKVFRFGHSLLIPTRVGDTASKLFLIDTGAMLNNISPEAAHEVTQVHGSNLHVRGISGEVKKVYEADKAVVQFSHFRQENLNLTTFDLSFLSRAVGTEVSGILGLPTLQRMILKIDYRDGLVDFTYKAP